MQERSKKNWRTDPQLRRTRTIVLDEGTPESKRSEILRYFDATFDIDEALLEVLKYDETFFQRADPLRHPLIFYFGHTAVFYINKLILAQLMDERIDPVFESMFAVGVDEMSWDDLDETHYDWPTVDAVQAYRHCVRERLTRLVQTLPLSMPITWDNPWWVIMMGIEHARIHLETSSVLIRQLPLEQVRRHPLWKICHTTGEPPENELLPVPSGNVQLGKTRDHALYGWDNEFGRYEEHVDAFRAGRMLVSNREFLGFVEDGGYRIPKWWTEEGWRWREYEQAEHPRFWRPAGSGNYRLRCMVEEIDMPWDWPVEVNYLEAKAFCNWKSAVSGKPIRLPTEPEWYRLRDGLVETDQPYWPVAPGNINLEHYASSCPVTEFAFGDFNDIVGNVWQWTETPITGFKGFEIHPYYDDFSTPTFDAKHNLIKGGSWISTGNEATRDSRYAFRRHFYQHAGFRYVESAKQVSVAVDTYEMDDSIARYCEFHYGQAYFGVPNFPTALAEICLQLTRDRPRRKALDLGCSVGRASFELARGFDNVTGLDFSAREIQVGVELLEQGFTRYRRLEEGELFSLEEVTLADLNLDAIREKVAFYQADACNLKELYTGYDLILAANLIDRLYDPRKFLIMIHQRLNPGGLLVIASPYSWDENITDKEKWLGGIRKDGEPYSTLTALHEILAPHFNPVGDALKIPFVLRITQNRFEHTLSEVTVWEKKRKSERTPGPV
ncbi:MAG: SAM-dependent methyltransferase [Phycisphaerae bacterium SG8_4]|nr:MAG: SAM-dependent methyltransferase [Phycisphaerae bacterium SG8_4]